MNDTERLDRILGRHSVHFSYSKAETRTKLLAHLDEARKDEQLKSEHYWIRYYGEQRQFYDGSDGDMPYFNEIRRHQQFHKDRLAQLTQKQEN